MMESSSRLAESIRASKDQLKALNDTQRKINGFRKLGDEIQGTAKQLEAAKGKMRDLRTQMEQSGTATESWRKKYDAAATAARKLSEKLSDQRRDLGKTRTALREAGVDTGRLTEHESKLKERIDAANKSIDTQKERLKRLGEQQARMASFRGAVANVGAAGGRVGEQGRRLAGQAAIAGAAGGYLFKTQFLDRAAEFEKFNTILKTVTGSEEKAAEAMSWVSDFAAKTPYELSEVLESFTQLKAYGIDPVADGLLRTLGDTASAMGKPVIQAVEAIADAVTGENERLKEFGIKASKDNGVITYEYTNAAGETLTQSVDASNRRLIQSTLAAIWNEKYAGAMDDQSRTWNGMISNLSDQWARFTNMVMGAGLFDRMRERLGDLLERIDTMAANGELAAWAERIGKGMLNFADGAWQAGKAIYSVTSSIADAVGGWRNLLLILAALKLAPLIISVLSLAKALAVASKALFLLGAANPVVLAIIAVVALIAGAAYLIYKYWEPISGFFKSVWSSVVAMFSGAWAEIKAGFSGGLGGIIKLIVDFSPYGLFYRAFAAVLKLFGVELPAKFSDFGKMMMDGLVNGIRSGLGAVGSAIKGVADSTVGWFKEKLGIHSPSRVFAGLGDDTMAGLERGLQRSQGGPLNAVLGAGQAMAKAGALALGIGGAGQAVAIDNRPPISAAGGPSIVVQGDTLHIQLTAPAGADLAQIEQLFNRLLDQRERHKAARLRSALSDTE
ncbi:tape measure protein [Halopseudomonas aestusnigri]|uniref:tape measure protein n=1 Tax=Halopseudomonas aestusnigri TaxID=857252 RepID=UPI001E2F4719|nr:tape measure protein [Halopseudomonas aestusnigri]UGV31539.1 tape measure protein [Halopseudomonas aestusnigri]